MSEFSSIDELSEELARLSQGPETSESGSRILELMEDWVARPGGADELVERSAPSENEVLVRTIAFLLARSASSRAIGVPVGPLVLRAIELLRSEDESARVNLLSALQLSSMHNDLLGEAQPMPSKVMDLLIDCAGRSESVQAALAPVVAALHAHGVLDRAPPARVEELRRLLRQIRPKSGSLLEMELADLAPFLSG